MLQRRDWSLCAISVNSQTQQIASLSGTSIDDVIRNYLSVETK